MPPPYLPNFLLDTPISPETGKQDKIDFSVGRWKVIAENREEALFVLSRLGAPPPVYNERGRPSRLREDHGDSYGWIFNSVDTNQWSGKREVKVRASPLSVQRAGEQEPLIIPQPLFKGVCEWIAEEPPTGTTDLFATLNLNANPTRFVRHHWYEADLPEGMRERPLNRPAPYRERSFKADDDNWFPLAGRLYSRLKPAHWQEHLARYFTGIESAFEQELSRVCDAQCIPHYRSERRYNLKTVETYWEWLSPPPSPDPLKVVEDLAPYARTFSSRHRAERIYDTEADNNDEGDVRILRIQHAPGETLKIYAKTNLRIRLEVIHRLSGRGGRFQFPREADSEGVSRRHSAHTFDSLPDVYRFLNRLRVRAATVVNSFLRHVGREAHIVPSHISAYNALLNIAHALPDDFPTILTVTSLLINSRGITPRGDEATRRAIDALRACGIIELTENRKRYVPTADYRHAFQMLRQHASFSILTRRQRNRPSH